MADVAGSLAWTPMDVIKQKTQVLNQTKKHSSIQVFQQVLKSEGILGLYRGFWMGILTYGPYVSIYFALYEQFKYMNPNDTLISAALASNISAALTCPLDVIKTRIQVYNGSVSQVVQSIWTKGSFFQGIGPRMLWMSLGTTLTMCFYEEMKFMDK